MANNKGSAWKATLVVGALPLFFLIYTALGAVSDTQESWSAVEGSSKEATVVKSQFGVRPYHSNYPNCPTGYVEWFSCIVVETENGETGTFICKQEDPIAGLSVGDDCTICVKQRSSLTNNDTAYFVNDVMVYHCTEEALSKAFLKDY